MMDETKQMGLGEISVNTIRNQQVEGGRGIRSLEIGKFR